MSAPAHWVRTTLDAIKADSENAIAGGPFGSDLTQADYVDHPDGVPVIRGCNLGHGERRFYPDELVFVHPDKAEALRRSQALPGDVIFTQRGTVSQVGLVPDDLPWRRFLLSQSQMKLTCDPARADPEYVYYWCRSPEVQRYVENWTIAAGVPHTNLSTLRQTPLLLPPLPEQRAIAAALSALDRRISLCDDQRAVLVKLVDLLFRTWFIEHQPTADKAVGRRHPTVDPELYSRLAPAFHEHDDRRFPLAYRLLPLTDLAEFQNGSAFGMSDFSAGEGLPIIKIGELKQGITRQTRYCVHRDNSRRIDRGDLLLSWSGNPDTSIDTFLYFGGPAWLNQHIFKVVTPRPEDRAYMFGLLRSLKPKLLAFARAKQTTGLGHVTLKDLKTLVVEYPPVMMREAFDSLTAPYFAKIGACDDLRATLVAARDDLLLRLMSAQARLRL
ncbi:restriction endonuclease subunit S [Nannocystis radixulma]|uniref:Restriction endonuclease subunit S n=1 Tax=Nannocystis radixulma TaxID=2995305 RepID=A0ABT5BGU7_9BACT|nr:restriction endonuclease subunit S [Nannocystis radixulma]MDC0672653.1 restriction endonuclease subunit S [Nannocystis radixulma]